jgi:DNA transformation protein
MTSITSLPNISKVSAEKLAKVWIYTAEDLKQIWAEEAFLKVRLEVDDGACLSMLYGLKWAIEGIRWHNLPEKMKKELKTFYKNLKV